ncbi:MAG: hypothetical protein ABIJ45_08040 [Candidatus Zixiibacteriota bacterium]
MLRHAILISAVFLLLATSVSAQSVFTDEGTNSYSAFGGYLKVEDYDPGTIIGFGMSSQKSVDVEFLAFKNDDSSSIFNNFLFEFSYNIVKNKKKDQPFNTALLLGLVKVDEFKAILLGCSNSIYFHISKAAFAPSLTLCYISGKDSNSNNYSETGLLFNFPLCLFPENNIKLIIEPYLATVDNYSGNGFMVRLMYGGI